jgi:hypothetical protein
MKPFYFLAVLIVFTSHAMAAETTAGGSAFNYAADRVTILEKQIAERLALLPLADKKAADAIRAAINYRIATKTLLSKGREGGERGALAMMYGHTLMRHRRDADRLFEQWPSLLRKAGEGDAAAARTVQAISRFNAVAAKEADALDALNDATIDRFLTRLLEPLRNETLGQSAWFTAGAGQKTIVLKDLGQQIEHAPVSPLIKTELRVLHQAMRSALRPQPIAETLDLALQVSRRLAKAEWIGSEPIDQFKQQLHTTILLTKDARTRPSAVQKLAVMNRTLGRIGQLRTISKLATPVEPLLRLTLANHQDLMARRDPAATQLAESGLDRLLSAMVAYRDQLGRELPVGLRLAARTARKTYQQRELALLGAVSEPSARPASLADRVQALDALEKSYAHVRRIYTIPAWSERMKQLKPKNPNSILHQLTKSAVDSTRDNRRTISAFKQLADLEWQVGRYVPMPNTTRLRAADKRLEAVTGGTETMLLVQVDRLHKAWAEAYATGQSADDLAKRLERMRRLLETIQDAVAAQDLTTSAEALNRWAAWDAPAAASNKQIALLNQRIGQAGLFASIGNWSKLDQALDSLEQELAHPLLIGRLTSTLGLTEPIPAHRVTLQTLLDQTTYLPGKTAFGRDQRHTIALICVYRHEAYAAANSNQEADAATARERVNELSRQLLKSLASE